MTFDALVHREKECEGALLQMDRAKMIKVFRLRASARQKPRPEAQTKIIAALCKRVAALETAIKAPRAPEPDDYDKWFASKEAEKYAGLHVAFESGKGVIASAKTADELMAMIESHENPERVSVSIVPSSCRVATR